MFVHASLSSSILIHWNALHSCDFWQLVFASRSQASVAVKENCTRSLSLSSVFASWCRKRPDEESEGLCALVNPVKLAIYIFFFFFLKWNCFLNLQIKSKNKSSKSTPQIYSNAPTEKKYTIWCNCYLHGQKVR